MLSRQLIHTGDNPIQAAFTEVLGSQYAAFDRDDSQLNDKSSLNVLCNHLEDQFDRACARGLAQQIGRSVFTHYIRRMTGLDGFVEQSFRFMPAKQRLLRGLEQMERLVEGLFGISIKVVDTPNEVRLMTPGLQARNDLIPHLEMGFIQEFVQWVSGGKPHPVCIERSEPGWSVLVGMQPFDS